jgi:tripeptidyl-peptidase-1
LLGANYGNYTHTESRRSYIRTLSYSIPEHLKEHIDYLEPGINFAPPPKHLGASVDSSASVYPRATCSTNNMMPSCIQALYGLPTTVKNCTLSSVGVGNVNGKVRLRGLLSEMMF